MHSLCVFFCYIASETIAETAPTIVNLTDNVADRIITKMSTCIQEITDQGKKSVHIH